MPCPVGWKGNNPVYFAGISPEFIHTPLRCCGFDGLTCGYKRRRMTTSPLPSLLADPRLTTMGLLMETHAGLRAASSPTWSGTASPARPSTC